MFSTKNMFNFNSKKNSLAIFFNRRSKCFFCFLVRKNKTKLVLSLSTRKDWLQISGTSPFKHLSREARCIFIINYFFLYKFGLSFIEFNQNLSDKDLTLKK